MYMKAVAEVARIAGDIAMEYYESNPATSTKSDGSPVSIADINAEQAARDWIELRFPEDGIMGEELSSVRTGAARRWILDPIDGTYTFLQSVPLWGTLVAVAEGDSVLAGAAYFPALDEIIVAARGEGCWWNGSRAAVSMVADLAEARLVTTDARFLRAHVLELPIHQDLTAAHVDYVARQASTLTLPRAA
jgi:fructose-1,6-bisphosphatase/inositol monophosphatase family enzyme